MKWAGWNDDLAGIRHFEVEIFKLRPNADRLDHVGVSATYRNTVLVSATHSIVTTLTKPGKVHYGNYHTVSNISCSPIFILNIHRSHAREVMCQIDRTFVNSETTSSLRMNVYVYYKVSR